MSDNLLPCLKVRDWEGRELTTCRVLLPDKASQFMPWLAFGYDHPHTFEFLNADKLKTLGMTEQQVEAQALDNLRKRSSTWQPLDTPLDDGKTLKMLVCMDDFFAAERILDAAFMQDAQRRLGEPGLLVGVPRRGLIMATPLTQDQTVAAAFGAIVASQCDSGDSAMISPMCFIVVDGAVVGFMETVAEAMAAKKAAGGADDDEAGEDSSAPYVSVMTVKNAAGKLEIHIMGGGEDGDRLVRGLEEAFHQVIKKYNDDPEFGRAIKIVVFGYTPPAAQEPLPKMLEHLRGIIADMQGHGMPPIAIEMEIQKDDPFRSSAATAAPAAARSRPAAPAHTSRSAWYWIKLALQLIAAGIMMYGVIRAFNAP